METASHMQAVVGVYAPPCCKWRADDEAGKLQPVGNLRSPAAQAAMARPGRMQAACEGGNEAVELNAEDRKLRVEASRYGASANPWLPPPNEGWRLGRIYDPVTGYRYPRGPKIRAGPDLPPELASARMERSGPSGAGEASAEAVEAKASRASGQSQDERSGPCGASEARGRSRSKRRAKAVESKAIRVDPCRAADRCWARRGEVLAHPP